MPAVFRCVPTIASDPTGADTMDTRTNDRVANEDDVYYKQNVKELRAIFLHLLIVGRSLFMYAGGE